MPSSSWLKTKLNQFEQFGIDVIYGRAEGIRATLFAAFLQALSYLFSGIAQARYFLYRKRIFHDQPLGCLVVVVGNLTVGGTGKTPVVEKFARSLQERGLLDRVFKNADFLNEEVAVAMQPPLPAVDADASLDQVYEGLSGGTGAVVVASEGRPTGILTRSDLLEFLAAQRSQVDSTS